MQISQLKIGDLVLAMDYSLLDRVLPRACWKTATVVSVRQITSVDSSYSVLVDLSFDNRVHRSYFLEQLRAINSGAKLCSANSIKSNISLEDVLANLKDCSLMQDKD